MASSSSEVVPFAHLVLAEGNEVFHQEMMTEASLPSSEVPCSLETNMMQKLSSIPSDSLANNYITIFRLPAYTCDQDKFLFEPRMVSIGPFYHGNESLRAMDEQKWKLLQALLDRNPKVSLKTYIKLMNELEVQARLCYSESIDLSSDEFVEMLLLDSCFILEFFFKALEGDLPSTLRTGWAITTILIDLLLMQNQIPFFIVERVYDLVAGYGKESLNGSSGRQALINSIPELFLSYELLSPYNLPQGDIYHLLHLYYCCFVPQESSIQSQSCSALCPWKGCTMGRLAEGFLHFVPFECLCRAPISQWLQHRIPCTGTPLRTRLEEQPLKVLAKKEACVTIPSTTELFKAGISFRKKASSNGILDITFKNGVMEMPYLEIDENRQIILTNLLALEQSHGLIDGKITSYLTLMSNLVRTENDLSILQRRGIMQNLSSEAALLKFFRGGIPFGVLNYKNHYFSELFSDVQRFYKSRWPEYRARLMRDYFNNPWSVISLMAGILLLVLSAVQTACSAYPLIRH